MHSPCSFVNTVDADYLCVISCHYVTVFRARPREALLPSVFKVIQEFRNPFFAKIMIFGFSDL